MQCDKLGQLCSISGILSCRARKTSPRILLTTGAFTKKKHNSQKKRWHLPKWKVSGYRYCKMWVKQSMEYKQLPVMSGGGKQCEKQKSTAPDDENKNEWSRNAIATEWTNRYCTVQLAKSYKLKIAVRWYTISHSSNGEENFLPHLSCLQLLCWTVWKEVSTSHRGLR